MAYASVEPIGEDRNDYRMAVLASLTANVNRDSSKRPQPYKPSDFIEDFWGDPEPSQGQTWQEQLALVEMFNAAFGGKDLRIGHSEEIDGSPGAG